MGGGGRGGRGEGEGDLSPRRPPSRICRRCGAPSGLPGVLGGSEWAVGVPSGDRVGEQRCELSGGFERWGCSPRWAGLGPVGADDHPVFSGPSQGSSRQVKAGAGRSRREENTGGPALCRAPPRIGGC